jgi:hypothetical protein
MKKIGSILFALFTAGLVHAQEIIKVGEEKTISCTGSFISEVQYYYSSGEPSSKGRTFLENKKDSLILHIAYIDNGSSHTVYKYSMAKVDIDKEDGIAIDEFKENGAAYQVVVVKAIEQKDIVKTEKHSNDKVENEDNGYRLTLYFAADKGEDAKQWMEKIKTYLK